MQKTQTPIEFKALVQQWSRSQLVKKPIYLSKQTDRPKPYGYGLGGNSTNKKPITCFHYGKIAHMAKEFRSRLAEANPPEQKDVKEVKPMICFSCREVGHKSSQCPNRRKEKVKKIKILSYMIQCLAENYVMASVNSRLIPMTLDSGQKLTIFQGKHSNSRGY